MRHILFLFTLLLIAGKLAGQPSYTYGLNSYYGGVFRYKSEMPMLQLTNLFGAEAYLLKQTDGSRVWEKKYNLPKLGLAATYFNYGLPEELGEVLSLTGFLDTNLKKYRKDELRLSLGTGIVYSNVIYNSITNPENKAVGSKISYVLRGNIYYVKKINENWDVNLHAAFRHYSNGRMQMPNNGMNFPVVGAGVSYTPKAVEYNITEKEDDFDDRIHLLIYGATAWREVHYDDYKHRAYSISLAVSKRITWYNAILIGIDGFSYSKESIRKHFTPRGIMLELEEIDGRQSGITLGNELYFGKLSLLVQAGIYIYDPHKVWDPWYQRYSLKYHPIKNGFIQIGLISHTRTANMVEWGFGLLL